MKESLAENHRALKEAKAAHYLQGMIAISDSRELFKFV